MHRRKRRYSLGKQSALEKVGIFSLAVQRGRPSRNGPLISLINRTKTAKQMGPAEELGLLSDPPRHAFIYAHMNVCIVQYKHHIIVLLIKQPRTLTQTAM